MSALPIGGKLLTPEQSRRLAIMESTDRQQLIEQIVLEWHESIVFNSKRRESRNLGRVNLQPSQPAGRPGAPRLPKTEVRHAGR